MTAGAKLLELIGTLPAELRERVFTHASWAGDRRHSYERLEFLGDSVLGLAIAQEIFERFPDFEEGRLAKIRAHVVSRRSCADVGVQLGLGQDLASRGRSLPTEEIARLSENRNVLAAVVEAVLGAVYLVHGFEVTRPALIEAFGPQIDYALNEYVDYKTELQEALARLGRHVQYTVVATEGPPHDRRFTCAALIDGQEHGAGRGASKKAAEQMAAREALAWLEGA